MRIVKSIKKTFGWASVVIFLLYLFILFSQFTIKDQTQARFVQYLVLFGLPLVFSVWVVLQLFFIKDFNKDNPKNKLTLKKILLSILFIIIGVVILFGSYIILWVIAMFFAH